MPTLTEYITQTGKDHVVFDLDATLALVHFYWEEGWGEPMREPLQALDPQLWEIWATGKKTSDMQNAYVERFGDLALGIVVGYAHEFESRHRGFTKNPGLQDEVRTLPPHVRKYIWSSNTRPVVDMVLAESGLAGQFDKIVTRDDVRLIKANPEGFHQHIYDPSVSIDRYLMVGDSQYDRRAAAEIGMGFFYVDYFAGQ